jgi:hypothetical protein
MYMKTCHFHPRTSINIHPQLSKPYTCIEQFVPCRQKKMQLQRPLLLTIENYHEEESCTYCLRCSNSRLKCVLQFCQTFQVITICLTFCFVQDYNDILLLHLPTPSHVHTIVIQIHWLTKIILCPTFLFSPLTCTCSFNNKCICLLTKG